MLLVLTAVFFVLFVITGVSYAMISITGEVRGVNLHARALDQFLGDGVSQARRGTIFDRNGSTIATHLTSYTIFANMNPDHGSVVEDIPRTARRLAGVLDLSEERLVELLSQEQDHIRFGNAGTQLSFTYMNRILEMELDGIGFIESPQRFYPNGEFASHTIGYTTQEDVGQVSVFDGEMGLEAFFNDKLEGENGHFQFLRDRMGFLQPNQEVFYLSQVRDGYNIYTTLDTTIQTFLETAMDEIVSETEPEGVVGIVMDAYTGELLAMGSRPTFDPNIREIYFFTNAAVQQFEPGSTMKIFSYAATINQGHYRGSDMFMSGSRLLAGGTPVSDFRTNWGRISFDEGFFRSSNTAVIDMLEAWPNNLLFLDYLADFGFGQLTNIPLYGEVPGRIPNGQSQVDLLMSGFGQGLYVTPIQQVQGLTAILNEGELIRPQLIHQIIDPNTNEIIETTSREVIGNPIAAQTAQEVKDLMIGVVEEDTGTGRASYTLDVSSGGKTGTAEIFDSDIREYLDGEHIYSYIGFAPADNPRLIMYVALIRPTENNVSGHHYLGQMYQFVMNNALSYLGLAQNLITSSEAAAAIERKYVPNVMNLTTSDAKEAIEAAGFEAVIIGDGPRVFQQLPSASSYVVVGNKVFIQTDITDRAPDFRGWTRAELTQYSNLLGIETQFTGDGVARRQSIRRGTTISEGDTLEIRLRR